jgi:ribosomal protein L31E
MGKAKKLKVSRRGPKVSLDKQIEDDHFAKPSSRVKVRIRKDEDEEVYLTLLLWRVKVNECSPIINNYSRIL